MATALHIPYVPVEEYLHSTYRPDCDYIDGEVLERNVGEQTHSLIQAAVIAIFRSNRRDWGYRALPEQRVQVAAGRYRIPDVCLVRSTDPIEPILTTPPVLCIEVLSPEDRFQRIQQRIREYQQMGVAHTWVIDPESREIWTAEGTRGLELLTADALPVPGHQATIPVADLFAEIDEAPRP